jgi:hypothetical protein
MMMMMMMLLLLLLLQLTLAANEYAALGVAAVTCRQSGRP